MLDRLYFPKLYRNKEKIQAFNMLEENITGSLIANYILSNLEMAQIISRMDLRIGIQDFFDILEYFGITRHHKGLMIGYEVEEFLKFIINIDSEDEEFQFFKNFLMVNRDSIESHYKLINYINFENFLNMETESSFNNEKYRERFYNSFVKIRNSTIQSKFRSELLNEFQNKCAICSIQNDSLLIASHIIPFHMCWEDPKLPGDSENGLLLCVLHDSLFESGRFIAFDSKGDILINPLIEFESINLAISRSTKLPNIFLTANRIRNLKVHERLFDRNLGGL